MLQPYRFGVSSRRGTVMACLEHGRATATTFGRVSEPLWAASGFVAGVDDDEAGGLVGIVDALLADPAAREALAAGGSPCTRAASPSAGRSRRCSATRAGRDARRSRRSFAP